jgi:hypothetical protein
MKVVWPQSAAVIAISLIHVPNAYIFVNVLGLGFQGTFSPFFSQFLLFFMYFISKYCLGAAIAAAISQWLIFLSTIAVAVARIKWLRYKASNSPSYELVDKNVLLLL